MQREIIQVLFTTMKKAIILLYLSIIALSLNAADQFAVFANQDDCFLLANGNSVCPLVVDADEYEGVKIAVDNLRKDIFSVCGKECTVTNTVHNKRCVIVGNIHSSYIRNLIQSGKIDKKQLAEKNEKYILQVVKNPMKDVEEALVIAGSDKRGTIYGIYELSKQIGVSPWYYWADVPAKKHPVIGIKAGIYTDNEPAVKYRGIFLNDEWPSLGMWTTDTFGGFNHLFYQKVFELLLRLKGNFLWPAMWNSAFYADDSLNSVMADKMGIIVGTSHHEPMCRSQKEWHPYNVAESKRAHEDSASASKRERWDYAVNADNLNKFWAGGVKRNKTTEDIVTVGMRGDGDMPMDEGCNIKLLTDIIANQRNIISKQRGCKAKDVPQVWALYKEVQDYYDKGMQVPDDITLLLCDDNWGNVRKLPDLGGKKRTGGYGMYYHFDYVGGPRNSKWLNINPIPRVWEQMNLAYEYGVQKLWIVNVGDLKPMEYPITFFLDMAWNPDNFNSQNLNEHAINFCTQQFGEKYAKEAARILSTYAKYNRRVTPEMLSASTYSFNYDEWPRVVSEYDKLLLDAYNLGASMPNDLKDAYDELILFPVQACDNLYNMYFAQAKNQQLAAINDQEANSWADKVEECFARDTELMNYYNHTIAGGKWNHIMDQVHIGYTSWNNPAKQTMPKVTRVSKKPNHYTFEEKDGYVSIEAEHFTNATSNGNTSWNIIPDFGKTLSGITTLPVTKAPEEMFLEYKINMTSKGNVKVILLLAPTLNFNHNKGLRYAISFNGEKEQIVNFNGSYDGSLGEWQGNPIIKSVTAHNLNSNGECTLRFRPLDQGIVLEKIMIDAGGLKPSYLGAPETIKINE